MRHRRITLGFGRPVLEQVGAYWYVLLLVLSQATLHAQSIQSNYRSISYRDGIKGHAPHASMISSDGKLWVNTEKQLNYYNGHTVKAFPANHPIPITRFNNLLFEAPDGAIWAGGHNLKIERQMLLGEKTRLNVVAAEEQFIDFQAFYKDQLPFQLNEVINVCSNGTPRAPIYICTDQGRVFEYSKAGFRQIFQRLSGQLVNTVLPCPDGSFWIGRPGRVDQVDSLGQILASYPVPVSPIRIEQAGPGVFSLYFWPLITYRKEDVRHLLLYPGQGIRSYLTISEDINIDISDAAAVGYQEEGLWHVVSEQDWKVFEQGEGQIFSFKESYPEEARGYVLNNIPNPLYFDKEGVAYACLYSKILALGISRFPFRHLFTEGINSMRSMAAYRSDTVLISSYSGLMGYNPVTHDTFRVSHDENHVWLGVLQLGADTFLVGNHRPSLERVDATGSVKQVFRMPNRPSSFFSVTALFEDAAGRIWAGTSLGLAQYNKGDTLYRRCTAINRTGALNTALVRHITEFQGQIWLATSKGLYSVDPNTRTAEHHLNGDTTISINYLYWAAPDTCWMATNGEGLWRWSPSSNEIRRYNRETIGLPNDVHHAVYPDQSDRLWVPSNDGLIWLAPASGHFGTFTRQSGLPDNEFNTAAHLKLPDGRLILGGVSGAIVFHPDSALANPKQRAPLNLVYLGVPDKETGLLEDRTEQWLQTQQISLSPLTNTACHLRFHVASYLPLEHHQYDYRIDGQHEHWIPLPGNDLVISGLPYGAYTLRVRGKTNAYAQSSDELRIPLTVSQPYYEQWLFWLFVAISTLGIGYALLQIRLKQLRRSEKRLRQEVELRTKTIEQDKQTILAQNEELEQLNERKNKVMSIIGHEVRGNLFFIGSATRQILQTLKTGDYESAEALSRNIHLAALRMEGAIENLTRWATLHSGKMPIHKGKVEIKPLLERLVKEHQPMADRKGISLKLQRSGDLYVFADPNAVNICLQNLLRNALKFTDQGGQVALRYGERAGSAHLEVEDSGTGMEAAAIERVFSNTLQRSKVGTGGEVGTGLGLNITKELVGRQSGKLSFESEKGKGTTVSVLLPLYKA